tara:strand:- start:165 stop:800 length:636 start_codon:yes stop_codon:yes gene_type:complete
MKIKQYTVDYSFYEDYIKLNSSFPIKMKKRIEDIRNNLNYKSSEDLEEKKLIKEYFVEVFSWSVLPYITLIDIYNIIKNYCKTILDPCCGNSFHSYLFENFTSLKCISYDIQDERNSWTHVNVKDGIDSFQDIQNDSSLCLLLSWIDYDELCIKLLEKFKGNIILSIGNYYEHNNNCNYLKKLNKEYISIFKAKLNMPWGLYETIEIYLRK